MVELRGITWDHPRGLEPLVAASHAYSSRFSDVSVQWSARPLQAFADAPIHVLARDHDLVVIDHPHVGRVAHDRSLVSMDGRGRDVILEDLAHSSIGGSHNSYIFENRQWALAIDAAAQVSAFRADLLEEPPKTWNDVLALARGGQVVWPLKPVDALMSFYTLTAILGTPCTHGSEWIIDDQSSADVLMFMRELSDAVPVAMHRANPIDVLELLSSSAEYLYCPLLFGYSNYARRNFRPKTITFTDLPEGADGCRGSVLGGTGIAVSATSANIDAAVHYAFWLASDECQSAVYGLAGGQPAHEAAWDSDALNDATGRFFRNTRRTLDGAWLRPRHAGYLEFQTLGGNLISQYLRAGGRDGSSSRRLAAELERTYAEALDDAQ